MITEIEQIKTTGAKVTRPADSRPAKVSIPAAPEKSSAEKPDLKNEDAVIYSKTDKKPYFEIDPNEVNQEIDLNNDGIVTVEEKIIYFRNLLNKSTNEQKDAKSLIEILGAQRALDTYNRVLPEPSLF